MHERMQRTCRAARKLRTYSRSCDASDCEPVQAVVIAALEEHLYAGEHQHGAEDAYPAAFVVLTSLLGGAMTWKLSRPSDCLGPVARWVQLSVYASKLSMLLVPQVQSQHLFGTSPSSSG